MELAAIPVNNVINYYEKIKLYNCYCKVGNKIVNLRLVRGV